MQGPHQVAVKSTTTCVGRRTPRQSPPVTAKIRLVRLPVPSNARVHRFIEIALSGTSARFHIVCSGPRSHTPDRVPGGFLLVDFPFPHGVCLHDHPRLNTPIHFPQIVRTGLSPLTSSSNPALSSITCTSPPILLLHTHTHTHTSPALVCCCSPPSPCLSSLCRSPPLSSPLPFDRAWRPHMKRKNIFIKKRLSHLLIYIFKMIFYHL